MKSKLAFFKAVPLLTRRLRILLFAKPNEMLATFISSFAPLGRTGVRLSTCSSIYYLRVSLKCCGLSMLSFSSFFHFDQILEGIVTLIE